MGKKPNGDGVAAKLDFGRGPPARTNGAPPRHEDRSGLRTLGPVSDLERHLPSEWWRTLFNSLYLETDGDIVENDRTTEMELSLLVRRPGLQGDVRLLALCCGPGRHSLEVALRGFQ